MEKEGPRFGESRSRYDELFWKSRRSPWVYGKELKGRTFVTSEETGHKTTPTAALIVLGLGTFMTLLDLTIVNVAIPSLGDGLHASLDQILWVLNAYSLVYAVLLITSGRLGDVLGPRNL